MKRIRNILITIGIVAIVLLAIVNVIQGLCLPVLNGELGPHETYTLWTVTVHNYGQYPDGIHLRVSAYGTETDYILNAGDSKYTDNGTLLVVDDTGKVLVYKIGAYNNQFSFSK